MRLALIKGGVLPHFGSWKMVRRAGLVALLAAGLAGAVVGVLEIAATSPPMQVSVDGVEGEMTPDTAILVSISRFGVVVADVALYEAKRGMDGEIVSERWIPVKLVPAGDGPSVDLRTRLRLRGADGSNPLSYDGLYRLRLALRAKVPAFPLPEDVHEIREYVFATLTTPRPRVPDRVAELGYKKPLEIQWSAPIDQFRVEVVPAVEFRSWIDPIRRDVSYVDLDKGEPGKRYEVRVVEAVGANGAPLVSPASMVVETAAPPHPIPALARVEDGNRVVIQWDRPLRSLDRYEITPAVESVARVDPRDPRVTYLLLKKPAQQQEYRIEITGGVGTSGAPLAGPYELTVVTPPPLEVGTISPGDGAYGVALDTPIVIVFGEAIRDRAAAEAAIEISPSIPGRFQWPEQNRVEFVPQGRLPDLTDITVRIKGGPGGVRGAAGGYLEDSLEFSFRTRPNKLIDVDLTSQQLTLYEGDSPVFTTPISTGVKGAETPTGQFMVNYKLPSTRMRGVNPGGSRYDIPDVPWVMSFLGDYTLHGAPWRGDFGFPQSNGCVSMETGAAKRVYDWTPIGTPVRIHY